MRVCVLKSDNSGCHTYRIKIPFNALNKHSVVWATVPAIPSRHDSPAFKELYGLISQYDLVIVQRCPKYPQVKMIRDVCDLLGKKMIYETDDDYFHIPPTNPAYPEMSSAEQLGGYQSILGMADLITVTTQELKDVIYPFNKNVYVLPNNIESIPCGDFLAPKRDFFKEDPDEQGQVKILTKNGLLAVPAYWEQEIKDDKFRLNPATGKHEKFIEKKNHRTIRIGYTATPSHTADFDTIAYGLDKILDKYAGKIWFVLIGGATERPKPGETATTDWFINKISKGRGRIIHVPTTSNIDQYYDHLRNIDIGLAPLVPDIFNMSKSPIKAIEYAMWGVPAVLPNYITYTREFTHNKTSLLYNNAREFSEALEELINNHELREKLGAGARDHVRDNRLERLPANVDYRYNIYKNLLDSSPKYVRFEPDEEIKSD